MSLTRAAIQAHVDRLENTRSDLDLCNEDEHERISMAIEHLDVAILDLNIYLHLTEDVDA